MRKYFIYLLCIPFLLGSSCGKDDLGINRKMIGQLNGERWEARGAFGFNLPFDIGVDLIFEVYNRSGELREKLIVYKVPFEVGQYDILVTTNQIDEEVTGAVYRTFSDDGDVIDNTYRLHDPADNMVVVTKVDTVRNIVRGEVNATFLVDPHDAEDTDIDTIRIENGLFEITLRD